MSTNPFNLPSGGKPLEPANPTGADMQTQLPDKEQLFSIMDAFVSANGHDPITLRKYYDVVIKSMMKFGIKSSPPSMAASDLARKTPAWTKWSAHIGVHISGGHDPGVSTEIENIRRNVKYPLAVKTLEATINVSQPNMANFVASIKAWTSVDRTIQWDAASDAPRLWEPLLNTWSLTKNAIEKGRNEATQHSLTDDMVHLIFYQSVTPEDERYEVLLEASLALPLPTAPDVPVVPSATADAVVMKEPPELIQTDILDTLAMEHIGITSMVECLLLPLQTLHLGVFPLESKRSTHSTALHQVGMDLCSIQHQRRVLCLKKKRVYGATCVGGKLQLYVSMWRDEDMVLIRPVSKCVWELKDPVQFIQCLYFLRALKNHLDASIQDDFDSFDKEKFKESIRGAPIWRTEPGTKRKNIGEGSESSAKRSRTGSGVEDAEFGIEDKADDVSDSLCDGDMYNGSVPYDSRPMTIHDFVKLLPYITDELLKHARIDHWQLHVASSDHEQTVVHDSDSAVMEKAIWL
ncbi:hypothetical protein ACEPAF_1778 [Sanghuangporus sanghuang]